MTSILLSLLLTLRGCVHSRAALQFEVLALRHQLQVLERSRPAATVLSGGPPPLGVAFACLARVASGARHREGGDGHRMAPPRLSSLLASSDRTYPSLQ